MKKILPALVAAAVLGVFAHSANACTITDNRNGAQCQGICAWDGRPLQCTTPWYFPRPMMYRSASPYQAYPYAGRPVAMPFFTLAVPYRR